MAQHFASKQPTRFRNTIEKVVIVGAGGQSGKYITEALLQSGKHKVTAITRADSTSTIPEGCGIRKVNYNNKPALVDALRGQDALIITMSVMAPPESQQALVEAAADADVSWILPNEFGGDPMEVEMQKATMIGARKVQVRENIERLGKSSWIGFICSFWYEYSLSAGEGTFGFDWKNKTVTLFDDGERRINTTTWPQVGRGVASLLSLKILPDDEHDTSTSLSSFRNSFCYVSSFNINQREMLESVQRITGTEWTTKHQGVQERYAEGVEQMKGGNRTGFAKLLYARVFFDDNSGDYEMKKGTHNKVLGLPTEELDKSTKVAVKRVEEHGTMF